MWEITPAESAARTVTLKVPSGVPGSGGGPPPLLPPPQAVIVIVMVMRNAKASSASDLPQRRLREPVPSRNEVAHRTHLRRYFGNVHAIALGFALECKRLQLSQMLARY